MSEFDTNDVAATDIDAVVEQTSQDPSPQEAPLAAKPEAKAEGAQGSEASGAGEPTQEAAGDAPVEDEGEPLAEVDVEPAEAPAAAPEPAPEPAPTSEPEPLDVISPLADAQEPSAEAESEPEGQPATPTSSGPKHARHFKVKVEAPLARTPISLTVPQVVPETPVDAPAEAPSTDTAVERPRRKWLTALLALLVLVLGAYLAGVIGFMHYFMPNTTLGGMDVSLKSVNEVAQMSSDAAKEYTLAVTGQGVEMDITAASIKMRYDGSTYARTAIKTQRPWTWPLTVFGTHELDVDREMTYDAMLLNDLIESKVDAVNKDATDPVDAKAAFDEGTMRYKINEEQPGTRLDKSAVVSEVHKALNDGETQLELSSEVLVPPSVLSTDETLVAAVEKANSWLSATQELVARDEVVATVDATDLHKWIKLNDKLELSFDGDACTKWAQGDLSLRLDTAGGKRSFTTPDGRQITVEGGTYGWSINGADVASRISQNVQAGESAQVEVTWLLQANTWNPGGNEWGDTYIEIDLGAQHVRYFQGGKLTWESDCVSGGMNTGKMHYTPTGVYSITSNMQSGNVELRGEIDPKTNKPEYISYVKYWMPFIGNSHALHDADWRSAFGGDIYLSNGSHGCVNLPPDKAAQLYGMVSVGTVVVVHS